MRPAVVAARPEKAESLDSLVRLLGRLSAQQHLQRQLLSCPQHTKDKLCS